MKPIAAETCLTIDTLRELLRLDPETGQLYWRERAECWFKTRRAFSTWNARYAGKEAFTAFSHGYRVGRIFDHMHRAHRVVFALHHGRWPVGKVDHKDLDRGNNLPGNFREATTQQNGCNSGSRGGTSRFKGVHWDASRKKWAAKCSDTVGRERYLGRFTDEIEAARAYDAAALEWQGEFARVNFSEAVA